MDERRRYFRVTDEVGLAHCVMPGAPVEGSREINDRFAESAFLQLESRLASILEPLRSSQPLIHEALDLFNKKINLVLSLGKNFSGEQTDLPLRFCQVSLSACGIAFRASAPSAPGTLLQLDLLILSSNLRLRLATQVVGCDSVSESHEAPVWLIRGDFVALDDGQQELLVQHVMKSQSQELKRRREARERGQ
ncbi:MAG: hypothetical protein H6999_08985 [Hahellaceae bacterium]|nr:hypothetical protein [Hahellaceae bacterium]MCP5169876.1 hypothetical protein [Hahellaceae bacterium]